jgi:hypothetical protein
VIRSRETKILLAKMLSGFANAAGGLILWGVTARKNERQIDCISKFPGGVDGFVGGRDHLIHPGLHMTFRCLQLPAAWHAALAVLSGFSIC